MIYTGPYNNIIYTYLDGIAIWSYATYSFPFALTFPAGTTRVRITSTVSWLSGLPDFVPTANQTTANVTVSKSVTINYAADGYINLILNNNITPSATFLISAGEEM